MTQINNSDLDILNREYSPSSCIDDIYVYIQHYIKLSREAKVQANNQGTLRADLQYAESKIQRLDLYLPTH
jgi:arylformamidase